METPLPPETQEERFSALLEECRGPLERLVRFRIPIPEDAEDILQEARLRAWLGFGNLRQEGAFKPWLLRIARNLCSDYFRQKVRSLELPLEEVPEWALTRGVYGRASGGAVEDTLETLADTDRKILYLYYWKQEPQARIAETLGIPLGTVKSRLHTARQHFRAAYPTRKDDKTMKEMPEIMPEYTIIPTKKAPFRVRWEELMGWMIIPRVGEKLTWAAYDFPERTRTELCRNEVLGRAEIHGIEGVEIRSLEYDAMDCNQPDSQNPVERRLIAQMTETHTRFLAESHWEHGVRKVYTFLDGDAFLDNWGFGENNCGNSVDPVLKGEICREGNIITCQEKPFLLDVVDRCIVILAGREYDTIRIMDIGTSCGEGVAVEQYLNQEGRTVLWRRFNRDDWEQGCYGGPWSQRLPDNERLTINGKTYVHWYDCVSDRIL